MEIASRFNLEVVYRHFWPKPPLLRFQVEVKCVLLPSCSVDVDEVEERSKMVIDEQTTSKAREIVYKKKTKHPELGNDGLKGLTSEGTSWRSAISGR